MNKQPEVQPCPQCGTPPHYYDNDAGNKYWICPNCWTAFGTFSSLQEATNIWNIRATYWRTTTGKSPKAKTARPKPPKAKPTTRKEVIKELIAEFQKESSELLAQISSQDKAAWLAHGEEDESRYGGLLWTIQNLEELLAKETKNK